MRFRAVKKLKLLSKYICVKYIYTTSEDLYSVLGIQSVAKVVRYGRLRWFGHVERKNRDDWVSACRNLEVGGMRCAGRGRKTWYECVKEDMKELGLHPEWAVFRDMWRGFISGQTSNRS